MTYGFGKEWDLLTFEEKCEISENLPDENDDPGYQSYKAHVKRKSHLRIKRRKKALKELCQMNDIKLQGTQNETVST